MKRKATIWIILFAMLFASPSVTYFFLEKYVDSENYENRAATDRPILTIENYASFSEKYESYFNDNIPYRNQLIRLNSSLDFRVFNDSSSEKVLIGKGGWLFYTGGTDPVAISTGKTNFTEEKLVAIANNLTEAKNYLEANGIEFVLFIAPNKESIYIDELPDYYPIISNYTQVMQLVDYLHENTDIRIVFPYKELVDAKEQFGLELYSRLDTHWNYLGAYIGAKALAEELGIKMSDLLDLQIEAISTSSGDLTDMLNITIPDGDTDYKLSGYTLTKKNGGGSFVEYHNEKGDDRKILIERDSFGARLTEILQSKFQDMYVLKSDIEEDIEGSIFEYGADVFVYEIVERNIENISINFDYITTNIEKAGGIKTISVKPSGFVDYPYTTITKKISGEEETETVQAFSRLSYMKMEVPLDEIGELNITVYADNDSEVILYKTTVTY